VRLADAAASAFTDALGMGLAIGAAAALVAAIAVRRWLPAHAADEPAETFDAAEQAA
jgi:hypothetical protein